MLGDCSPLYREIYEQEPYPEWFNEIYTLMILVIDKFYRCGQCFKKTELGNLSAPERSYVHIRTIFRC